MRRRDFIRLVGGLVGAWPLATRAQQGERVRRVAALWGGAKTASNKIAVSAFAARLEELGWRRGHNLLIDERWWIGTPEQMRGVVTDMLAASPDVFVAWTNLALAILQPMATNVPAVFVGVGDPVGSGFIANLAHPGGHITGFSSYDGPFGAKWLEVLKDAAPQVRHVMPLLHPETPVHKAFLRAIESAAPNFGVEVTVGGVHDAAEIERAISDFAANQNAGLIVLPHAVTLVNQDLIVALTLRHRLPASTGSTAGARDGYLVSYEIDFEDSFRHMAEYVDRILRGEKPANLPVQEPTKFKLAVNLKTARAIGLTVPSSLLVRADEVIE